MSFMVRYAGAFAVILALAGPANAQGAKLPPEYIEDERTLTSMEIGETANISQFCIFVSKEREVSLFPKCNIWTGGGTFSPKVVRQSDGYHLYLGKDWRWSPSGQLLSEELRKLGEIPVKEIHIEP